MTAAAIALAIGQFVTFTFAGTTFEHCMRIALLDLGPGDVPSAWIVATGGAPRMLLRVRLVDLRPGCSAA